MEINEYQSLAARTINRQLSPNQMIRHGLFGLCAETGEVLGLFQKHYQGHDLKSDKLKKELGDVCWMVAELCTAHGWSMEDIMNLNIEKLEERYPDGFDPDKSVHRKEEGL